MVAHGGAAGGDRAKPRYISRHGHTRLLLLVIVKYSYRLKRVENQVSDAKKVSVRARDNNLQTYICWRL